ncbi:MAG: hypothetical protein JHC33_04975 [Ignisphaera sp.]|nr:hypothetical protein [Ignisphaera sp.]
MSLYTPESIIRRLILEAEDLTLSPSSDAQAAQDFTAGSTPGQVASDMATAEAAPAAGTPGLQGSTLTMPQVTAPQSTISKTVINKDIILSQLAELKSVITNYEKRFEGDDLTPEDANVYISSLLSTLVFHAEKFNAFMESAPGGGEAPSPIEPMPEAPIAEMPAPTPEALPELPQV